jgi:hemolysin D
MSMANPDRAPGAAHVQPPSTTARVRARAGNVLSVVFGGKDKAPRVTLTAEERAFLPAAMEVVETPASPTLRLTGLALCTVIAAAVIWASLSHIDMVATASGKVVPLGQVKVVQPLETSAIRAIRVDDGDHVQAGELLVELDPTDIRADLDQLQYDAHQAGLDAEVARLLLTRDVYADFHAPQGVDAVLAEANHSQANSEIRKHLAQVSGLEADMAQRRAAAEAAQVQIARADATIPIIEEKHATAKGLYDKKYGARPPVLDAEQALIEKKAERESALASARQSAAELASLEAKLSEIEAGFMADASDRRTKALQKLAGLTQQIAKARQRESYRKLVSPVAGTVQGVKIHTPGAVVTTADTLMTIVPDGTGIEAEALVENKDVGFVREGQEVEIKLDAFPFTRYGLIKGRVRKLGRDAATPQQAASATGANPAGAAGANGGAPAPGADLSYPAKVTLAQDYVLVDGAREPIRPGMRVAAEIKTGDRRVIEYLLSPVMQAVQEAGRER